MAGFRSAEPRFTVTAHQTARPLFQCHLHSSSHLVNGPDLRAIAQTEGVGEAGAVVANDPVNQRDPTGLVGEDEFKELKQAKAQLNKTSSTLAKASGSLGKTNTVTQAAEATEHIVITAPKIAVDSVKVAGAAVADSITVTSNAVIKAASAIENWPGGRPTVRSHNGNTRVTSPDGNRQFRHETREKTGSVPPHMHLDQRDARGNMRAALGTPDHIFPQEQQDDEQ